MCVILFLFFLCCVNWWHRVFYAYVYLFSFVLNSLFLVRPASGALHYTLQSALHCNPSISSVDACQMLVSVVVVVFFLCICDPILCYLSLFHFITDSFMLFYVFMFIFIFHHWLSLFVRLTHLYWNKRAQLMVCLDFFCSQFHLSVYSIQYAFSVLVLNVLSPVSRLYVCVFFFLGYNRHRAYG